MIANEPDKLPSPAPRFLKLLLGLPSDATPDEVRTEWGQQVIPLFSVGPKVLFDELVMNTMAGGLPAEKAYRVVAQTKRGQQLKNSMDRETGFRQRAASAVPPFLKPAGDAAKAAAKISNSAGEADGASTIVQSVFGDRLVNDAALDGWVQISPYGEFAHARGKQYLDRETANKLVHRFAGSGKRGLPWYRGHPDTHPQRHQDTEAYGWMKDLQARTDGLYAHVEWTPKGDQLIRDKSYKYFSPVWDTEAARVNGKSVFKPTELISVGFTNTPTIPVGPINR